MRELNRVLFILISLSSPAASGFQNGHGEDRGHLEPQYMTRTGQQSGIYSYVKPAVEGPGAKVTAKNGERSV